MGYFRPRKQNMTEKIEQGSAEENAFFVRPILNSPYEFPKRHWELIDGQPTQRILEHRRPADFVTPIPKVRTKKQGVSGFLCLGCFQGGRRMWRPFVFLG